MDIPDAAAAALPRESWATAVAQYAVNVLGLLGVGAILNVILGQFWEPRDGGGLLGFALLLRGETSNEGLNYISTGKFM